MINDYNTQEGQKRRFDIGSGQSLELLDSVTLDFVFHKSVIDKVLGSLGDVVLVRPDNVPENKVYWDRNHGVGMKGGTKEVIFLGASSANKVIINKLIAKFGNIQSLTAKGTGTAGVTHEYVNSTIEKMARAVSRKIAICTAVGYTSVIEFITDLVGEENPTSRMMSVGTKDTNQKKVLAFPYKIGASDPYPDSHVLSISQESADIAYTKKYNGPFAASERAFDFFLGSDR